MPYDLDDLATPTDRDTNELVRLVRELREARQRREKLAEELKELDQYVEHLSTDLIPEHVERTGFRPKGYAIDGVPVTVKREVFARVPAGKRGEAYDWLDENGYGHLIKRTVQVAFGRDEECASLESKLEADGFRPEQVKKVEPSTLSAWVRDRRKLGQVIPDAIEVRDAEETVDG